MDREGYGSDLEQGMDGAPETTYGAVLERSQTEILADFTEEQQREIQEKLHILSALPYFIGKDFSLTIELNEPGKGWHWDFESNIIRMDPKDILEKPMEFLRFVVCHEGGHRRISRTGFIPKKVWAQPGFSFMMNAIEDTRDNNFVAESYPKFKDQMAFAYKKQEDFEGKAKEKANKKFGYQPRFMEAGFEYIKQWYREVEGKDVELSEDLRGEVREVVEATLESARDSGLRYPSKEEADESEETVVAYAKLSYEINRDEVWPEFKKLVEMDIEDSVLLYFFRSLHDSQQKTAGTWPLPPEFRDTLTPDEAGELEALVVTNITDNEVWKKQKELKEGEWMPTDLSEMSDGLKKKILDYMHTLEEEEKQIREAIIAAIKELEKELNEELQGRLVETPPERGGEDDDKKPPTPPSSPKGRGKGPGKESSDVSKGGHRSATQYEKSRSEMVPVMDKLENELREIFVARQTIKWETGFKTGKRLNVRRRMQERAKGIPAMESKAAQRRELPDAKDYAITLLIDLSGSMGSDGKIQETFKTVVALAEVLNRLSINVEILGFNDRLYEYQTFNQPLSEEIRESMGGMLKEVGSYGADNKSKACYNDDGWAVEQAAHRLMRQKADRRLLFVLSDGQPAPSARHNGPEYELAGVVRRILQNPNMRVAGLGVGKDTQHVEGYYPDHIANVEVKEVAKRLAGLVKKLVEE